MFFKFSLNKWIAKLILWVDPNWFILVSLVLFLLMMVHFAPLTLDDDNHKVKDHFFLLIRRILLVSLFAVGVIVPMLIIFTYPSLRGVEMHESYAEFESWITTLLKAYWMLPIGSIIAGVTINMSWHRYAEPYFSNVMRRFRVNQITDQRSDIRREAESENNNPKNFNPEIYFKTDQYFFGLSQENKPVYIDAKTLEGTHTAIFGPTGFGKGVLSGVLIAQAIRRGNTCIAYDPKGDENLPFIMQNEAKKAGKPFVYLDLNESGKGNYHPFKKGSKRDRRIRMLAAFGLERGGTDADVYKSKERAIVDFLIDESNGSIADMLTLLKGRVDCDLSLLRDGLTEWSRISTFTPPAKKDGHDIEKSILNNAIVYVRGSVGDSVIKAAGKCYISEVLQTAGSLASTRTTHLTLFIDELRFAISNEVVDGLAAIRSSRVNMLLATQSIGDLLNIQDANIDGKALRQSYETNCQIKLLYNAGDTETAVWGEKLSGTQIIRTPRNERLQTNRYGGEKWEQSRVIDESEEPLIHRNVLLSLQSRVAVLYRPGYAANRVFTAWMQTDKSYASWEKPVKKEPMLIVEPKDLANGKQTELFSDAVRI